MYYYNYLNKVIGTDSLYKGRVYPPSYIDYIRTYQEQNHFVHLFYVDSSNSSKIYDVTIESNGFEIYKGTCTCPQYNNYHTCKHLAACLLYYRNLFYRYEIRDLYKETSEILDLFYKPSTNINIKEKMNVELNIIFYDNMINYRLSLGTSKLYVLNTKNKLENFIKAYTNGGDYIFGTKFTYNKNKYYFDASDAKIIEYLFSIETKNYAGSDVFTLHDRDFQYLIENIPLNKLKINGEQVKDIMSDLPTTFKLNLNKDNDYELKLNNIKELTILTQNLKYIYNNNIIYVIPEKYRRLILELYKRDMDTLIFKKEDFDKFNHSILGDIKDKLELSESITNIDLTIKPTCELYFDFDNILTCKAEISYGNQKINLLTNTQDIIRDYNYEEEILKDLVNYHFIPTKDKLIIEDIDELGNFLENGLTFLSQKYTIYTSKKINNTNLIKKSNISKDFSIGTSGIMSFNFNIDNIDMNELKDIFNSLKSKKTYHKLKNGDLINLEDNTELQDLNSLIDDLEINYNNLTTNIEIPKYKALYIDSLKNNVYKDITTNNVFNEFINNFKTYQNISLKFSKKDNEILRDYQKLGIKWLYTIYKCDLGGILADEMGLGKSIQTIYFIKEVLKSTKDAKILIVCPTSLVYNWKKEFDKFGSELKYKTISDNKTKRLNTLKEDINIYITSYGLLRNDLEYYKEINFEVCVIDEAQYIKNYQAGITKSLKELNSKTKIALTGTPLENSITELWSIFDFLMPGYLNSVQKFREKYHISDIKKEDLERLAKLNNQIKPFILRRKKSDVIKDLPDKIENNIYLELPDNQKKLYLSVLKETEKEINEIIEQEGYQKARFKVLTLLTKLREICIAPQVLYENYNNEAIKITKLVEIVADYIKEKHKILIFSSFKRILDLVKIEFEKHNISYYSIDGSVKGSQRVLLVDKFNSDNTSCFLITLKSGGTGLNLTSADIVIHLDIWWNPQAENQATDRTHRIGQTKKVIVNRLITKGTIEERILELQEKKKILSDNIIEGNTNTENLTSLTEEEFKELLSYNQE